MKIKITAPFFYNVKREWYFAGDLVEGEVALAALAEGVAIDMDKLKMPGSVTLTQVDEVEQIDQSTELNEE